MRFRWEIKIPDIDWILFYRLFIVLIITATQVGCASVSHDKLFDDVKHVRTTFEVRIEFSSQVEQRCRQKFVDNNLHPPSQSIRFGACAMLLPDSALTPGKLPWCEIVLPEQHWQPALAHEILHCMGFAHN